MIETAITAAITAITINTLPGVLNDAVPSALLTVPAIVLISYRNITLLSRPLALQKPEPDSLADVGHISGT